MKFFRSLLAGLVLATSFAFAADPLQLDIEAVAEKAQPMLEQRTRIGIAATQNRPTKIALTRTGKRDQPFHRFRREPTAIDRRSALLLTFEI